MVFTIPSHGSYHAMVPATLEDVEEEERYDIDYTTDSGCIALRKTRL